MRKNLGILILFILIYQLTSAQTYTWDGTISSDFSNPSNWTPSTWTPMSPNGTGTVIIGKGNPYNPTFTQGGSKTTQRYGILNTTFKSSFTINGSLYTWNNDSLNGQVNIQTYAELNIRNIGYVGRGDSGTITVTGSLSTKYDLYIGYGSRGIGFLKITDGTVNVGRTLYIGQGGSTGHIQITGLGALHCTGNVSSSIQTWINNGTIFTDANNELAVSYDAGTNVTTVSINRNQTGMVKEYSTYIVLDNGIIKATIDKSNARITSLLYNGVETVSQSGSHVTVYYDCHSGSILEGPSHCIYSITRQSDSIADVSFKRVYTPSMGDQLAEDMDIHFVIKKNVSGLYTYSILTHPASYPDFSLNGWRMIFSLANNGHTYTCEKLYVDSLRHWVMPSIDDYNAASPTGIKEIVKLNTGVRAGHYDSKYEYVADLWNLGTWGLASDINKIGTWMVMPSHEFFNLGPNYHDLNSAAGIIHVCLNSLHYNAQASSIPNGQYWSKIFGPYLMYFNDKDTGDESWKDAQQQAKIQAKQWPYDWLKNNPDYPLKDGRGSISGRFIVNDPFKPNVKGANAWIGVTQISNPQNQWQFENLNYEYWVRTDSSGHFTIANVRPGKYSLFAYTDGEVGEYKKLNMTVSAGKDTIVGDLNWNIVRNKGKLLWEIGIPNRSAEEFAHGHTDYFEGYVYNNFVNEFSNPIEYNVADKNWSTALPYAHCPLLLQNGTTMVPWTWRLNFDIKDSIPSTGYAHLTFAFASSDHAQLRIYVNDESKLFTNFYPDNAGGNALQRQAIHAMYSTRSVPIPMNLLHKGSNTISLVMPSVNSMRDHIMYDYISLEAPVYDCSGVLNGTAFIDSCKTCAGGNTGITPVLDPSVCNTNDVKITRTVQPNVFPNPFHSYFHLNSTNKVSYKIFDLTGKLIEQGKADKQTSLGENLNPGIYLLETNMEQKYPITKLIKY